MLGHGGKSLVAQVSGMNRNTVIKAEREVESGIEPSERLRALGGGDRPLIDKQPGLLETLDSLLHADTRGNPMSLLRWTSKPTRHLADPLVQRDFQVFDDTVGRILKSLGDSLQAGYGTTCPDPKGCSRGSGEPVRTTVIEDRGTEGQVGHHCGTAVVVNGPEDDDLDWGGEAPNRPSTPEETVTAAV
jgi:hypothetical protein